MKKRQQALPKVKIKKINTKKFVSLAKRVRKYLLEEEQYLKRNENNKTTGLSLNN